MQASIATLQAEGCELAVALAVLREALDNAAIKVLQPDSAATTDALTSAATVRGYDGPAHAHRRYAETAARERELVGRTDYGQPTRGSWIKNDGTVERFDSGTGSQWYGLAREALTALGRANGDLAARIKRLATHSEVQLVARLAADVTAQTEDAARRGDSNWRPGAVKASIQISRRPCGTEPGISPIQQRLTCDKQLGNIIRKWLPPGSSIVVVDPDGEEWTYPKGAKG